MIMGQTKKYIIEEIDGDLILKNFDGNIEFEIIEFESSLSRLIVRDIDLNNRKPIEYSSVENIIDDYPEHCI